MGPGRAGGVEGGTGRQRELRPTPAPTRATPRLLRLLASDFPDRRLEEGDHDWARLSSGTGPVIEVASRVQRRFLGRTEVAVFAVSYPVSIGDFAVALAHDGKLRRSGLVARRRSDGEVGAAVSQALTGDPALAAASMSLDFTRFDVDGDQDGCRATIELVGASYVSIAFPPIRSYVRLYPDQRQALLASFDEVGRILATDMRE